jgi:hypothetical protein
MAQPAIDRFPAGADSRIADAAVLGKCALLSHRAHANTVSISLENQPVSRRNSEKPAHGSRHRYLSLAGDFRFFLHEFVPCLT